MNDEQIDQAMRELAPHGGGSLSTLDFEAADLELLDAIIAGTFASSLDETPLDIVAADLPPADQAPLDPAPLDPAPLDQAARRRRRGRTLLPLAVAACVALIVGAVIVVVDDRSNYAEAAVVVAMSNERLLIDDPAWSVTRVNQFSEDNGEMIFGDGSHEVSINWFPAGLFENLRNDRGEAARLESIALLGQAATLVHYDAGDSFALILPPNEVNFLEIRADGLGGEQAFRELLSKLHQVGVEEWLDALPATAITSDERGATVDSMLADIDLPPGFDVSSLSVSNDVTDPYHLGASVVSSVVCGWFDVYFEAKRQGDDAGAAAAADALGASHRWKVLQDMNDRGEFPEVVWQTIDPIQAGGSGVMQSGNAVTREVVAMGFGCDW